ncbi:ribosome maturation factor RimM [Acholeplasma palmae]|nr:ribosome maturation factor RimM [Alteracholeplasma palmae]
MMQKIGRVINTHGVRGELKIKPETDFDRFEEGKEVYIKGIKLKIKSIRDQQQMLLIVFENYGSLNDVMTFKGQDVFTDEAYEITEEDTYHFLELIGLKVYTDTNDYVGVVTDVLEVPQGHLLEIKNNDNKNLVPFRKEFVSDVTNDKIIIKPIEGLLK